MEDAHLQSEPRIYNSRIVDNYIKLLKRNYASVDVDEVLEYAGMKAYEVSDQGHWFTQQQIDRFHAILLQKTGNEKIAREAGRFAGSPEALGVMRQFAVSLVGPAKLYEKVGAAASRFTKSCTCESHRLSSNSYEIVVTPLPGTHEKPFQCENRIGFWEAIAVIFNSRPPQIEHPECIFKGGKSCRYLITCQSQGSVLWKRARNFALLSMLLICTGLSFVNISVTLHVAIPLAVLIFFILSIICEHQEKKETTTVLSSFQQNTNDLIEQIETNYNNSRLTNEIGEVITSQTDVEGVLTKVIQLFQKRLNYDRGMIMLANPEATRLIFRAGFGYTEEKLKLLEKTAFHLDRPNAEGMFVASYRDQNPFLVNNIKEINPRLSARSQAFAREMGSQSFICCPIICEGKSLGVLAVDNLKSKKPLVESDLSLLLGLAHVIGIGLRNVELLDERSRQIQSILQTLAASIDARDPLTAGHSTKVTEFALGICHELNMPKEYCEAVRVAALLHDYGKIGVPDSILKKPGRLTREEYEIVKTHAMKSREILEQINFGGSLSIVPEIAGAHHEKMDGSGYPLGLKGEQIPLGARIIAVADFFEAVTAKRHYRDPIPLEVAFHLLEKERGIHFEEHLVDAFKSYYQANHMQERQSGTILKKVS